jgi:hypothetical protein
MDCRVGEHHVGCGFSELDWHTWEFGVDVADGVDAVAVGDDEGVVLVVFGVAGVAVGEQGVARLLVHHGARRDFVLVHAAVVHAPVQELVGGGLLVLLVHLELVLQVVQALFLVISRHASAP